MADDTGHRPTDRKARGGSAARDARDIPDFPNLDKLRQLIMVDGDLLDNDIREAVVQAIRVLNAIEFTGYSVICTVCGGGVELGGPSPIAAVICPECVFWADRVTNEASDLIKRGVPNFYSIRDKGEHFIIDNRDQNGAVMTVRFFDGTIVVTTRLRQQGPIPRAWRRHLPDNATVIEGNPQQLPVGITRPQE